MKEEIKGDDDLRAAFDGADTAPDVLAALEGSERGRRFVAERLREHQRTFGYKAIWSHEFAFKTWVEDPAPIIEAIRGYLATDYDYPSNIQGVRDDLEKAKAEVMDGVEGEQRADAPGGARPLAGDEPADPGPPLLHRPGNERAPAPGVHRDRPQAGRAPACSPTPRTSCSCTTTRSACCWPTSRRSATRRSSSPTAATTARTPPSGARRRGSAPRRRTALDFPYSVALGLPREVLRGRAVDDAARSRASAASPGVVEGTARYVDVARRVRPGPARARSSCAG